MQRGELHILEWRVAFTILYIYKVHSTLDVETCRMCLKPVGMAKARKSERLRAQEACMKDCEFLDWEAGHLVT